MIEAEVYESLRTLASGNVFWGVAPSGTQAPFVVLTKISGRHDWALAGATGARRHQVQVDCYDKTPLAALTLAASTFDALTAATAFGTGPATDLPSDYNDTTGLHVARTEYTLQT